MTPPDAPGPRLSLWFVPDGHVYRALQAFIVRLSREHDAPLFEPHVTLLGDLRGDRGELAARAAALAAQLRPLTVRLDRVDHADAFFRALYLRAEPTPELLETHRRARALFGREGGPPYLPHLSLMYGHFPADVKQRILAERGPWHEMAFAAHSLHLVDTTGTPEGWDRIQEFSFAAS